MSLTAGILHVVEKLSSNNQVSAYARGICVRGPPSASILFFLSLPSLVSLERTISMFNRRIV